METIPFGQDAEFYSQVWTGPSSAATDMSQTDTWVLNSSVQIVSIQFS